MQYKCGIEFRICSEIFANLWHHLRKICHFSKTFPEKISHAIRHTFHRLEHTFCANKMCLICAVGSCKRSTGIVDDFYNFTDRNKVITSKLIRQGFRFHKLPWTFSKFYDRNGNLAVIKCFDTSALIFKIAKNTYIFDLKCVKNDNTPAPVTRINVAFVWYEVLNFDNLANLFAHYDTYLFTYLYFGENCFGNIVIYFREKNVYIVSCNNKKIYIYCYQMMSEFRENCFSQHAKSCNYHSVMFELFVDIIFPACKELQLSLLCYCVNKIIWK